MQKVQTTLLQYFILHISYFFLACPRSTGSGFPFQSFCPGQQKGFPLHSLTYQSIRLTIHIKHPLCTFYFPQYHQRNCFCSPKLAATSKRNLLHTLFLNTSCKRSSLCNLYLKASTKRSLLHYLPPRQLVRGTPYTSCQHFQRL